MRKNLKRVMAVAMTMTMAAALFVGCGAENNDMQDGKVKLELFSTKTENKNIMESLIADFEVANPDIKVEINAPADAGTVLKARLAKNDMPDLVAVGADATYGSLVDGDMLTDLTGDNAISNIQDSYLDMLHGIAKDDKGKIYGVPYATNADGVLYNKDMFKELGLEVPKTWDELMSVCEKVKGAGKLPFYLTLKDSWTGLCFWNVIASDLQPESFLNDKKAGKVKFEDTHKEAVDKMEAIGKLGQDDILGVGYDDGNAAFAQGKSAMYLQGNWAISEIKKSNPNMNVGMFPLPVSNDISKNKVISGIDVLFAVSKNTKHSEEAKKFIEFMTNKDNAQKYVNDQFVFSAVKDVKQRDESVSLVQEDCTSGKIGLYPDHYYPSSFDISSLIQGFYSNGNKDEFLKKLDSEYDKANSR